MKSKIYIFLMAVILATFSDAHAQRPFNKSKDILIAQFDSKPDPDDIHAQAALGSMLAHNDLAGVNYYAVAGAIGKQGGRFIDSDALFDMAFGSGNWTDADANRGASVTRIKNKAKPILQNGGKVWVQEAGQSDITRDWIQALLNDGVAASTIKSNVVVVQHSKWNEDMTSGGDLNWVKNNANYVKIGDGNGTGNGTPSYRGTNTSFLNQAKSSPNAKAKQLWTEADRVIQAHGHKPSHSSISTGGVDYSDCVENWWIFNIGGNADNIPKFWSRYVTNTTGVNPNPGPGSGPDNCADKTFEEKNGIVAVEAEDFVKQSKTTQREWFIIGGGASTPTPDPDPSHASSASGGKYVELLPDTRVTHGDPLVVGVSFSDTPGVAAILDYNIKFNSPGKYFVWVRAYSTGSEDNGIHVGIDGNWPESGKRMQWCSGKNAWTWESKQRTSANHCGVAQQIFINVPTAGVHTISFSMREDGFEMDKFIMSKAYTKPSGAGAAPLAVNCPGTGGGGTSGTVTIKGETINKYISSENGTKAMTANRASAQGWERFTVKSEGNGTVSFKGNNGKYVSSENGGAPMNCNRSSALGWEKFTLESLGGNVYAIKGNNGKYVSHENGGAPINCNRNVIGQWERFVIEGLNSAKIANISDTKILKNEIAFFPNPIKGDNFNVKINTFRKVESASIEVFNLLGQKVLSNQLGSLKQGATSILFNDVQTLKSGIYLVKVNLDDQNSMISKIRIK